MLQKNVEIMLYYLFGRGPTRMYSYLPYFCHRTIAI